VAPSHPVATRFVGACGCRRSDGVGKLPGDPPPSPFSYFPASLLSGSRGGGAPGVQVAARASSPGELRPRWSRAGPQRAPASSGDDDRRPTGEAPGSDFSSYKFCCRKNFKSFYLNFFYNFFACKVLFQNFLFSAC
jgi:hypothetical protein